MLSGIIVIAIVFWVFKLLKPNTDYKEYKDLGKAGEQHTYNELKNIFNEDSILRNVYLKKDNQQYTEIDLIVVSTIGIFVFESKNYSGWIFGNEQDAEWTQTIRNGSKYKFYNPIWQNKTHINALKNTLTNYKNLNIYSIIVFSNRCELKNITYTSSNTFVIQREELISTLKNIINQPKEHILSELERDSIIKILAVTSRPSEEIVQQHLKQIQDNKANR